MSERERRVLQLLHRMKKQGVAQPELKADAWDHFMPEIEAILDEVLTEAIAGEAHR